MRRGPQVLDVGGPEGLYADGGPLDVELVGFVFAAGPRRALFTARRRGVERQAARCRGQLRSYCSSVGGAARLGQLAFWRSVIRLIL